MRLKCVVAAVTVVGALAGCDGKEPERVAVDMKPSPAVSAPATASHFPPPTLEASPPVTPPATEAPVEPTTRPPTTTRPATPGEAASQANAREMARQYLRTTAFSRKGLVEQLEYEGFSNKDAVYGTDKQNANWNEQAARMAQQYLKVTAFSRAGLIEQLEFEGFTPEQARYGVAQTGL